MRRKVLIALIACVLMTSDAYWSQCVMCKAVGEQSAQLDGLGRGLNAGILFLMAIPYILLSLGGIIIWRRFNKEEQ